MRRKKLLLGVVDALVVFAALVTAYVFRHMFYYGQEMDVVLERITWLVWPAVIIHIVIFYVCQLYELEDRRHLGRLAVLISVATLSAAVFIALLSYLFPHSKIGRLLVLAHVPLVIIGIFLWRLFFLKVLDRTSLVSNLVFVGSYDALAELQRVVEEHADGYYRFMGIISDYKLNDAVTSLVDNEQNLRLPDFERKHSVSMIVVQSMITHSPKLSRELIDQKTSGTLIYDFNRFYQYLSGKVPVYYINENSLIFSRQGTVFSAVYYFNLKRILDIVVSGIGILLALPLFVLIPLLIKLTSRGPVIFAQERVGQHGSKVILWKFRSMVVDAEKDGPQWAKDKDNRITFIGAILRKTQLDELPQLFNILMGKMSFVGPRPIRKVFEDQFAREIPFYSLRHLVKPGLTGWAQVHYYRTFDPRADSGPMERFQYDMFYIMNMSFMFDIFIILKTFQAVLFGRGV